MNISKHALNRLIEFIVLGSCSVRYFCVDTDPDMPACADAEYPSVRAFALSPGVVRTRMYVEAGVGAALNTVELPAATTLYLTSGRADWLSGRYVDRPS
jgi:hypothetical protein